MKHDFSVLIGLVSTEDTDRIFEVLDALQKQQGTYSYEVIIADRLQKSPGAVIKENYPGLELIACPSSTSLPGLRTLALDKATGNYIVVIEDHCVPSANWLESIARAFQEAPEGTVAVGGCVENGVNDTALDWAGFFCEYSAFLEPVHEGTGSVLPGMNVAYHHSVFKDLDRELLTSGFWETTIHPLLLEQGKKLYSTNKIKLYHCKKFSFRLFAHQRYHYSRYYAGLRYKPVEILKRALAFCATTILPPLLLYRIIRQVRARNRLYKELNSAIPILFVFTIIWAWGEMTGYLLGKGDALNHIE